MSIFRKWFKKKPISSTTNKTEAIVEKVAQPSIPAEEAAFISKYGPPLLNRNALITAIIARIKDSDLDSMREEPYTSSKKIEYNNRDWDFYVFTSTTEELAWLGNYEDFFSKKEKQRFYKEFIKLLEDYKIDRQMRINRRVEKELIEKFPACKIIEKVNDSNDQETAMGILKI